MTARVSLVTTAQALPASQPLLQQVQGAFGVVPNMFKATANSPAALQALWGYFGALGGGVIPAVLAEKIAVAVADINRCEYCLAAHTALGRKAGATGEEMVAAQQGKSNDSKTAVVLAFAQKVVRDRATLQDSDVTALREVGFGDQEIVEILAHISLNIFTNYINVAFAVPVDFPKVSLSVRA